MTLKDFKPGQTAYVLSERRGMATRYSIEECTVVSVGQEYVKTQSKEFRKDDVTDEYLTENIDWGYREKLFLTKEAVNDYIEKTELQHWFNMATSWPKILNYSLSQLRAIKKILEGEES